MTEELKDCPFCGGKAEISDRTIYCPVCEISFSNERETGAHAIKEVEELWNARATDEVKREPSSYSCRACKSGTDEEIERLKTENARLRKALAFYAELDGSGIQLYGYMDSKALEFDDGESFPFGKKARDALKGEEND